ncbi:hypothetical protein ACOSYY_08625 [Nitrospira sp. BLG_2]
MPLPVNDPRLLRLVKIRAIEGFAIAHGQTAAPGDVVSIAFYVARDLCHVGRAAWVTEDATS